MVARPVLSQEDRKGVEADVHERRPETVATTDAFEGARWSRLLLTPPDRYERKPERSASSMINRGHGRPSSVSGVAAESSGWETWRR
jgi:hypothetical protein